MKLFLVRITAKTYKKLRELDRYHLDLKKRSARQEGESKFVVSGILSELDIEKLKKLGYKLEVLLDLSKEGKERRDDVSKTNRITNSMRASDVRKSIFGGYMNIDEVDYALAHLSNIHPDIVTLIELPHKTCEGRECKAIRISTNKNDSNNRIGVLFTG